MELKRSKRLETETFSIFDQHPSIWSSLGDYLFECDRKTLWSLALSCKFFYRLFGRHYWVEHIPQQLFTQEIHALFVAPVKREDFIPDNMMVSMLISQTEKMCCVCKNRYAEVMQSHPLHPRVCRRCIISSNIPCLTVISTTKAEHELHVKRETLGPLPFDELSFTRSHSVISYQARLKAAICLLPKKKTRVVDPDHLTAKQKRHMRLESALQSRGLQLRDDSWLCNRYLAGNKEFMREWCVDDIVQRMCEMRYIHEHPLYEQLLAMAYRNQPQCVNDAVEQYVLNHEPYGKYPVKFPWEK